MNWISAWSDSVDALSPDGLYRARMSGANELHMGSPTSGYLEVLRTDTGEVIWSRSGCNPSVVWASDSSALFFPAWTELNMQLLCKLELATRITWQHPNLFTVLELHQHRQGRLYVIDSPSHQPSRYIYADAEVCIHPQREQENFLAAIGYTYAAPKDLAFALATNPSNNFLVQVHKLAYLDWSEPCDELEYKVAQLANLPPYVFAPLHAKLAKKANIEEWLPLLDAFLIRQQKTKLYQIDDGSDSYTIGLVPLARCRALMRSGRYLRLNMKAIPESAYSSFLFVALPFGFFLQLGLGLFVLVMLAYVLNGKYLRYHAQLRCSALAAGLVVGAAFGSAYCLEPVRMAGVWKALLVLTSAFAILAVFFTIMFKLRLRYGLDDVKD